MIRAHVLICGGTGCTSSGSNAIQKAFADSIINDTTPPIDVGMALNWTAAGILSGVSADNGGVPIEVPLFR